RRYGGIGGEPALEGIEVESRVERVRASDEHRKAVAARGQEIVDRHPIALRRIDLLALEQHRLDALPIRAIEVIGEAEIGGRNEQRLYFRLAISNRELLLEQRLQLRAGERFDDQIVAERLEREDLPERDRPVRGRDEVGADTRGID